MYPDWPESDDDLVPLPECPGPKLKPFDFQGPQKIEFLEVVGEGLHAMVIKVKILKKVYALKVVSFILFTFNIATRDPVLTVDISFGGVGTRTGLAPETTWTTPIESK